MELLSTKEQIVANHIINKMIDNDGRLQLSLKNIADEIGISEATTSRTVTKLRENGIIGVSPTREKAEANEYILYSDNQQSDEDIMKGITRTWQDLNAQFGTIQQMMQSKDRKRKQIESEYEELQQVVQEKDERIAELESTLALLQSKVVSENPIFKTADIVGNLDVNEDTVALLFKKR